MDEPKPDSDRREGADDRRAFPRRRPKGTATYRLSSSPFVKTISVRLTCISQGGVGFVGPAKDLTVGQHFEMILQSPAAAVPLLIVKSEVRRIVPKENTSDCIVGVEFIDRLSYSQLIPFV